MKAKSTVKSKLQIGVIALALATTFCSVLFAAFMSQYSEIQRSAQYAALALLAVALLSGVVQAYLLLRAVGYKHGYADGGRGWIQRRRHLSSVSADSSSVHSIGNRLAFAIAFVLQMRKTLVLGLVSGLYVLISIAWVSLVSTGSELRLYIALLPTAAIVSLFAGARASAASLIAFEDSATCRRMVLSGSLPRSLSSTAPARTLRSRWLLAGSIAPASVGIAVLAMSSGIFVASGRAGLIFILLFAGLTAHFGLTNLKLYVASRLWWRDLRRRSNETSSDFRRGVIPPTPRILVDIVTPLGPSSALTELGGVLSDHRSFASAPLRWVVVTDPDRVDSVADFLKRLFTLHGVKLDPAKLLVLASASPLAGPKRNLGASSSAAPFIVFIDSDDRLDTQRLATAVASSLSATRALQTVHLFPFFVEGSGGLKLKYPANPEYAAITHHHCARLWPAGVFREGFAAYPEADFEDALLTLSLATKIDHRFELSPETAFLTYADFSNDVSRLTRSHLDPTSLLEGFASAIADAHSLRKPSDPTARERALFDVLSRRVISQYSTVPEPLRDSLPKMLSAVKACRTAHPRFAVEADKLMDQYSAARTRFNQTVFEGSKVGVVPFLGDELTALRPCALSWQNDDRGAGVLRTSDDADLGLAVGLTAAKGMSLRERNEVPTVMFNLEREQHQRALAALRHFVREPYFQLKSDTSLTPGEVQVFDPRSGERIYLGNFATDRLICSILLRLLGRFYPTVNRIESVNAHLRLQSFKARMSSLGAVRLLGTGPSSSSVLQSTTDSDSTVSICCNSWVRQPELMMKLGVQILAAADPIFHAGPSEYARQFRADVVRWLRMDPEHLFVTVGRDIGIYLAELPLDVHGQVIAPIFESKIDPLSPTLIESGRVQPYPNILTLLLLPLAELLCPDELWLFGFDGGIEGEHQFWSYNEDVNYSDELQQTVREWHPEFFSIDFQDYRDLHDKHVASWLERLASKGINIMASARSNIPAVNDAYMMSETSEGQRGLVHDGES